MGGHSAHDASFCLLHGGEIAVAIQEERLLGRKHANLASPQPEGSQAFWYCLDDAGLQPGDLDLLCGGIGNIPGVPLLSFPHHLQHAMSAFALSGMDEAAVLVVDGMGDNFGGARERDSCVNLKFARKPDSPPVSEAPRSYSEIISIYRFNRHSHEALEKHYGDSSSASLERMQQFPAGLPLVQSLGSMYQWVSRGILLGGVVSRDILRGAAHARLLGALDLPGKLMGLASYGEPRIPHEAFFSISGSGEFCFDGEVLERCLEGEPWPARRRECENFAASVQAALEEALLYLAQRARQLSGCSHLCYAGGLALNSVANERIVRESGFAEVFIPPPANDAGLALGAAFLGLRSLVGNPSPSPPPPPPQIRSER